MTRVLGSISLFVLVCCLGACSSSREAQVAPPPDAPMEVQLVEKNVAARGGLERLQAVRTLVMKGKASLPAMNMTLPMTLYQARPGRLLLDVEVPDMNMRVRTGFDGDTAWTVNPMMGRRPQRIRGLQARDLREQADLDGLLVDAAAKGYRLVYAGADTVRDRPVQKLRVVRPDSSEVVVYLDADSSLILRMDGEGTDPMSGGRVNVQTYMTDYRDVEGVRLPFAMEMLTNGRPFQTVTFEAVTVNEPVADSLFAMPAYDKD